MELVYLWVEKYKNIENQGFNFSPRFTCNYENGELTIEEKKDYVSIFPPNINVTAIVGENGSGKSNITQILDNRIINTFFKVIYFNNGIFYTQFKVINHTSYKIQPINKSMIETYDLKISQVLGQCKNDDVIQCKILTIASVLEKDSTCFNFMNEDFIFTQWKIDFPKAVFSLETGIKALDDRYNDILERISVTDEERYLDTFVYVAIKFIQFILGNNLLKESKYFQLLNDLAENFTENTYIELVTSIELGRFEDTGNYQLILDTLIGYKESITYIKAFLNPQKISKDAILTFTTSGVYITLHNFSNNNFHKKLLEINYITNSNLAFLDLSDGEQQRIFNSALLAEELMEDKESYYHKIYCLDEPDVFLHPNWQKMLISDFAFLSKKYLDNFYPSVHLILTSHSPFILSDLPKENVIFLENGKQVYPNIETFGANIHTLLSHGFFMKEGLMGEFAKEKIQSIIKYHDEIKSKDFLKDDNKQLREKEKEKYLKDFQKNFWNIHSIIGDEFIKQVIKNHLIEIEKILLGNDEAKQEEIKRLKTRIALLES